MIEEVEVKWLPGAKDKINKEIPDKIIYGVARLTLDGVMPTIPENTGKMRRSTLSAGVKGGNGVYEIGSHTNYAKFVYTKENSRTNWTTPGTNSYWFKEYFLKNGKTILSTVLKENK